MEFEIGVVLKCALKHGLTEADIRHAVRMRAAARHRNFDPPAHVALAGPDARGRMVEVLMAEMEDGRWLVYHAMKMTDKIAYELGLM